MDDTNVFTPTKSTDNSVAVSDRFIPNRSSVDFDYCSFVLQTNENENNVGGKFQTPGSSSKAASAVVNSAQERLKKEILKSPPRKRLIDCFDRRDTPNSQARSTSSSFDELDTSGLSPGGTGMGRAFGRLFDQGSGELSGSSAGPKKPVRSLPTGPSRVLDCPELMDDYYLNLLDWGHNNIIAVALRKTVYLWNASNGSITNLVTLPETSDYVSSLQWNKRDNTIAIGTFNNVVEIWDANAHCKLRELTGHTARVSSLSWNSEHTLSSGGRDSKILNYDLRQSEAVTHNYRGHEQEICGLAWSPDGTTLASGGNENLLCIWDAAMSGHGRGAGASHNTGSYEPRLSFNQHQAAVKALAWCPWHRNVLASGGGTADRSIRVWNTALGQCTKCVDTNSQVCALQWNEKYKELVSSHGFSNNQLCLWTYPNMRKIREFHGHTARVLHMCQSPDQTTIVSASADETLRFWELFGSGSNKKPRGSSGSSLGQSPVQTALSLSKSSAGLTLR